MDDELYIEQRHYATTGNETGLLAGETTESVESEHGRVYLTYKGEELIGAFSLKSDSFRVLGNIKKEDIGVIVDGLK